MYQRITRCLQKLMQSVWAVFLVHKMVNEIQSKSLDRIIKVFVFGSQFTWEYASHCLKLNTIKSGDQYIIRVIIPHWFRCKVGLLQWWSIHYPAVINPGVFSDNDNFRKMVGSQRLEIEMLPNFCPIFFNMLLYERKKFGDFQFKKKIA
jgi:hypothetical protein